MEYVRATHVLGINTPLQYGVVNSSLIHQSVTRVNVYFLHFNDALTNGVS
jgi:hypothetical protein